MSATFAFLAPLALMTVAPDQPDSHELESVTFAKTLVTAYTCDLLGYGVDYLAIADWGHETRERMMAQGATYDEAMDRIRADVTTVRGRFNSTYGSAITAARWSLFDTNNTGNGPQGRYMKTFRKRCDRLASENATAQFFTIPEERVSSAEFSRKVRALVTASRHGV